jgi:hypothetical protein
LRSKGYKFLGIKRVCEICRTQETYIDKHGYEHWGNHNGKRYCTRCYSKLVSNPKNKHKRKDLKSRTYRFIDKPILEDKKSRTGVCSNCNRKIGDKYNGWRNKEITVKQTQLHHQFYLVICPWFSRVELCVACHSDLRWKEWKEKHKNDPPKICSNCGADKNYRSNGWRRDPNGNRICFKCWRKAVYWPRLKSRNIVCDKLR